MTIQILDWINDHKLAIWSSITVVYLGIKHVVIVDCKALINAGGYRTIWAKLKGPKQVGTREPEVKQIAPVVPPGLK
jgi:hypothetical protein